MALLHLVLPDPSVIGLCEHLARVVNGDECYFKTKHVIVRMIPSRALFPSAAATRSVSREWVLP